MCVFCNKERLNEKNPKKKKGIKKKYPKKSGEAEVFKIIWEEREHICNNCLMPLGDEMRAHYFSHNRSKKVYSEGRLDKNCITILCFICHHCKDFEGVESFNKRKNLYGEKE